ncbi:hypothetical protein M3583_24995, partial [Bacillus subtilis]|nr:hypothetical protein [Bacillus subtilis]
MFVVSTSCPSRHYLVINVPEPGRQVGSGEANPRFYCAGLEPVKPRMSSPPHGASGVRPPIEHDLAGMLAAFHQRMRLR